MNAFRLPVMDKNYKNRKRKLYGYSGKTLLQSKRTVCSSGCFSFYTCPSYGMCNWKWKRRDIYEIYTGLSIESWEMIYRVWLSSGKQNKPYHRAGRRVIVVMIVRSVLPILQRKPIMMTCADRLRVFIKRALVLTFLLKNPAATVADQRTCLSCARSVPSKSVV